MMSHGLYMFGSLPVIISNVLQHAWFSQYHIMLVGMCRFVFVSPTEMESSDSVSLAARGLVFCVNC